MIFMNSPRIAQKVNGMLILLVSAILILLGTINYQTTSQHLLRQMLLDQVALQNRLQTSLRLPLWNFDASQVREQIGSEINPFVPYIEVIDNSGMRYTAGVVPDKDQHLDVLSFSVTYVVAHHQLVLGTVKAYFSSMPMHKTLNVLVRQTITELVVLDLSLIVALRLILKVFIFRRLIELRQALSRALIVSDPLETIMILEENHDEVGQVAQQVNEIIHRLLNDLVARQRAEAQALQALDQLTQAKEILVQNEKMAALGALVAGIAHELNTPIGNALTVATLVQECSQMLNQIVSKGAITKSSLQEHLSQIVDCSNVMVSNVKKAAELVNKFKQIAVNQSSVQRQSFILQELISDVLGAHQYILNKADIKIVREDQEPIFMDSFPGPLSQVFGQLIVNAVQHAFPAGFNPAVITLRCSLNNMDDQVLIECEDNGRGIEPQHRPHVFEPFFTTRMGQGGSGLGLHTLHNIVTGLLKGSVQVEMPRSGSGTRFLLRLPRKTPIGADQS